MDNKYTAEEILNAIKKYPESRPSNPDAKYITYCPGTYEWSGFDYGHAFEESTTCFIDIPGAPEELRPCKHPDKKPERNGKEYVVHFNLDDKWDKLYWGNGWFRRQSTGCLSCVASDMVDYFINYPLEEEMGEDITGGVVKDIYKYGALSVELTDDQFLEIFIDNAPEYQGSVWIDKDIFTDFSKHWLDLQGYDITKRQPEIAPCPNRSCNGERVVMDAGNETYYVSCKKCLTSGPHEDTPEIAIESYNLIAEKE